MASTTSVTQPADIDQIAVGDCLTSTSSKYQVQSILGHGTFGTVAKCVRVSDKTTVAIKMIKNSKRHEPYIKTEVKALKKLSTLDPDKCNIVRWYQVFNDRGHTCLMFENLEKSLYDFMHQRQFQPLPLKDIRTVVMQVANALNHLKAIGMIHADLKLENVMLVNHAQQPYRVKLIDFGLACDVSSVQPGWYTQSRVYRSPEIILGLPFTQAIDVWSLGCIAAALYLGVLLYPGSCEYDMIRFIVETQGEPSDDLLSRGLKTSHFFQRNNNSTTPLWKLKTPEQFRRETNISPKETRKIKLKSLDDLRYSRPTNSPTEMLQQHIFVDMLKGMLYLDSAKRLSPRQVLEYLCSKTWSDDDQTTDTRDSSAVMIHPPQPLNHKSTHPSTSGQTQINIVSGIKRKMPDSEESGHETKRVRESDAGRPTCSTSNFSTHTAHVPDQMKRKMADSEDVRHQQTDPDHFKTSQDDRRFQKIYRSPSISCSSSQSQTSISPRIKWKMPGSSTLWTSSGTQSYVSPGIKRKTPHDEASDSDKRSGHETKRVRESDAGRPTCSTSNFSTHTAHIPDQMKRKMADSEDVRHQQTDPDHFKTSQDDRRFQKIYRSPSISCSSSQSQTSISPRIKWKMPGSSTLWTSSGTQSYVSPGIKRKTPHDEASDSDKRSGHETKRVRESDAGRPTCSTSNFSTHTAHVPDQMKRKMADSEDVRHQQTDPDHFKTSQDDRRFQKIYRSPSISCSSSQSQTSISPRVKRKMLDPEDSDSDKNSGHKRKRVGESDFMEPSPAAASYCTQTVCIRPDEISGPTEHVHHSTQPASSTQTES